MKDIRTPFIVTLAVLSAPLFAQQSKPGDWTRTLKDRAQRSTFHDASQAVRGDSGKWNDDPRLQLLPPVGQKPANVSLDDWADRVLEQDFQPTAGNDVWLLFRSRQLNDNDRMWITRIERRGNRLTVISQEAEWQGRYGKNFTYYAVLGVNFGKLEPGKYEAKWIIEPLVFNQFEQPGPPRDNWPKDERPAESKPVELPMTFTVVAAN